MEDDVHVLLQRLAVFIADAESGLDDVAVYRDNLLWEVGLDRSQPVVKLRREEKQLCKNCDHINKALRPSLSKKLFPVGRVGKIKASREVGNLFSPP